MLRYVCGKGHPEFSTGRQQDTEEFIRHFLKLLDKSEQKHKPNAGDDKLFSSRFDFNIQERFEDAVSHKVRYRTYTTNILSLPIPTDAATNAHEAAEYEQRELKRAKRTAEDDAKMLNDDKPVFRQIPFEACVDAWGAPSHMQYRPKGSATLVDAHTELRLGTYPEYLIVQMRRFYAAADWTAAKLNCIVPVPEVLDLEQLRGKGKQAEEVELDVETKNIDESFITAITRMGFSENAAKNAFASTGSSNTETCISWILENLNNPELNDPPADSNTNVMGPKDVRADMYEALVSLGFTKEQSIAALLANNMDSERAADWLFTRAGDNLDEEVEKVLDKHTTSQTLSTQVQDGLGVYELFAIISHMGQKANSGHYVCHIKKNDKWVIFNDCKVAESLSPPLEMGYVYFYKRQKRGDA